MSKADANNQSALLVQPEADATASADTQSAAGPGEETGGVLRVAKLAVLIFLSFALPGAGILAWLAIKAHNARGEQFAASRRRANRAESPRASNQRRARGVDDRHEADWLDDFLGHLAQHPATGVRNAAFTSADPVQPRADVADVVLRNILLAFRRKAAAGHDSGSFASPQRRMASR